MKPIAFAAVLVAWLCTPARVEWHVDTNKNRLTDRIEVIAWTDAAADAHAAENEPGDVLLPAPICTCCSRSSAAAYWRMKSSDQGMPVR